MPYVPATFSCPHCRAPLRLRQRPGGTLQLPCPDCGRRLELTDQAGELLVRPAADAEPEASHRQPAVAVVGVAAAPSWRWSGMLSAAGSRLADPLAVTWLAAGVAVAVLAVALIREDRSTADSFASEPPSVAVEANRNEAILPETLPADPIEPASVIASADVEATPVAESNSIVPAPAEPPPPVAAPKPPASPPVDPRELVAARLSQRVVRFEQPTPVAFDVLRSQIEEVAGISIRYDESLGADPQGRDEAVSVSLSDATLGEVLAAAAGQAGLSFVVAEDGLLLVPAAASTDDSEAPAAAP